MTLSEVDKIKELLQVSQYSISGRVVDSFVELLEQVQKCEAQRDAALKKLEEYRKDTEIKQITEEMLKAKEDLRRGFAITESEEKAIAEWYKSITKDKVFRSAIGGDLDYIFTPTSIGVVGVVRATNGEEFCFREL